MAASTETSTDAQLVQAAQEDIEQYHVLYTKYVKIIYRYIYFRVGEDAATAEDLTATVFTKAMQNLATYKDKGYPYSSYLYALARTVCIDYYRSQAKQPTDIETVVVAAADSDPDVQVDIKLVWETLQEFEPLVVEVFELRYLEDLSFEEISRIVKKSPGALRTLVSRTIKILQKIYAK